MFQTISCWIDILLAANPEATGGIYFSSVRVGDLSVSFHGASFDGACAILRRFGAEKWYELHQNPAINYVSANVDGYDLTVFFDGPVNLKTAIAEALKPGVRDGLGREQ